ncbi:uncharacterized protein LOC115702083 [Cannabis sativa]|uniref:Late embryogenesis abundant protein LEA-2 subgroup domain-containing protein n=1 Tax=Cannabis sativa TaxID=3483 RepID=A0A7J6FBD7_CANSA|nr:uncharacterized protein LOC115702083 [Cannabis sativa]KAF4367199.1 hypothetical protein F8388_006507 [Cannabis sativa]
MVEKEQARPLAPAADRPNSSDEDDVAAHLKKIRRRKLIKCCGFITAVLLVVAVVIIILIFTVFRIKDPIIKMNKITVAQLNLVNTTTPKAGSNMSLTADVSVKNPNVASFKYSNTTTWLYYYGTVVGEAKGPPGRARPRRTMRMNITVDIIMGRIMSSPNFVADVASGLLSMNSYSRIPGRVKMLGIKRHVVVMMNCTMTVSISSQTIQEQKCKRKVKL